MGGLLLFGGVFEVDGLGVEGCCGELFQRIIPSLISLYSLPLLFVEFE